MGRRALSRCVFIVLVLTLITAGCGRKTNVVPPDAQRPEPITDLSYSFTGMGVELRWSYPLKTVTGEELDRVKRFGLWRAEIAAETYCPGCPFSFKRLAKIKAESSPATDKNRLVRFEDFTIRPGYYYIYKVRASSGWLGEGGDSNMVRFMRQVE